MSKKEAVEKIDGVVSKIGVSVSRKISDGAYGSAEVSTWVEMDVSPTADFDEAIDVLDLYLTGRVGKSVRDKQDRIESAAPAPATVPMVPVAPPAAEGHCAIHNVAMKKYTKEGRSWYSHKHGDAWCKGV